MKLKLELSLVLLHRLVIERAPSLIVSIFLCDEESHIGWHNDERRNARVESAVTGWTKQDRIAEIAEGQEFNDIEFHEFRQLVSGDFRNNMTVVEFAGGT